MVKYCNSGSKITVQIRVVNGITINIAVLSVSTGYSYKYCRTVECLCSRQKHGAANHPLLVRTVL
jgi:hypothetical protein